MPVSDMRSRMCSFGGGLALLDSLRGEVLGVFDSDVGSIIQLCADGQFGCVSSFKIWEVLTIIG
jgi:hypothetical protein